MPSGASTIRGSGHRPVTVRSIVPGESSVPIRRNQSAPNRAMSETWASDSTFWTRVGRPPTPRSRTGRSAVNEGTAGAELLMAFTTADSCPARNRSDATTMSIGHWSSLRRRRSSMARATSGTADSGTCTRICEAPTAGGRHRRPVEHQMGQVVKQESVLPTGRLALGPVGYDDRAAEAGPPNRPPLGSDRKPRTAMAPEATAVQFVEEARALPRRAGSPLLEMFVEADRPAEITHRRQQSSNPRRRRLRRPSGACNRVDGDVDRRGRHRSSSPACKGLVPVTVPERAPEFWSTRSDRVRDSGSGAPTEATMVP